MNKMTQIDSSIPAADIVRRGARLGAEIKNIRLSGDMSDEVMHAIYRELLEHRVVFVADQRHLDDSEQERFAVRLGKLFTQPTVETTARESILPDRGRNSHCNDRGKMDDSFIDTYPKISVVRGAVIPPSGGQSIWSNVAAAYLDLPAPLRKLADELWAVHSNSYEHAVRARSSEFDHHNEVFTGTIHETAQPVVRIYPETGERTLALGSSVQRFIGLQEYTGQRLFELLRSHIMAPENTVRWNWKAGDVVIWDNRAAQHYAGNEDGDQNTLVPHATFASVLALNNDALSGGTQAKILRQQAARAA
ncbi:TauD/TfdA family dioxygenase [Bradyrhizobium sp. CCGUVB4N]|uniref:TauD/TfdA dioxygenase family protein n=1 Tax=Bradyrhizobium sp. CCGUVB4N TaxID=2949631 RepID=UPI0020B1D609|nr:TauD/TfdA family dioxygenase [Bradyrhizobium sp. CCGUVB4N]MCP3380349.1 TauD/TfdA family dioxygenase [Bradyrhizobium sp. CCGUVB4N]